ncbi:MAG: hypothetical protein ACKO4T_10690 [Planctomycetaceae bacterium]
MTPPLYAFEITLQARPAEAVAGPSFTDAWGTWPTLEVPKDALAAPLAISFDEALDRLAAIERLYAEPDGSFVWSCSRGGDAVAGPWWQVDGNAADRVGRLLLVDLKGSCPPDEFDRLLAACGWPEQPVMMQLVRAAVFVDEPTFRRHALARGLVGDGETLRPT